MSITLYPYKLTVGEVEARIPGEQMLLPGQILRFGQGAVYGRVMAVRAVRRKAATAEGSTSKLLGSIVRIQLLRGQPDLSPQTAILLTDEQLALEVQALQGEILQPLQLSQGLTTDAANLGFLTIVDGDNLACKYDALMLLISAIQRYRKVLIVDPLGLFGKDEGWSYCQMGQDARLSLQSVGHQKFLDSFGSLLPSELRNWALQAVAASWPIAQDFIAFDRLLDWRAVSESPLKALILQNQQVIQQMGVFADRPNQVLQWSSLIWQGCNVLDLSSIAAPWKALCYQEVADLILKHSDDNVLPVLIYPDHYLTDWTNWLRQAEELELNLVMMPSLQDGKALQDVLSNRITAKSNGRVLLNGKLTLDLPVSIALTLEKEALRPGTMTQTPVLPVIPSVQSETSKSQPEFPAVIDESIEKLQTSIPIEIGQQPAVWTSEVVPAESQPVTPISELAQIPQVEQAVVNSSLDYPDAEEGAWPTAPPMDLPEAVSQLPSEEKALPAFTRQDEDFSFDLNLDAKPMALNVAEVEPVAAAWDNFADYSAVSGAVSDSLDEFGDLSLPNLLPEEDEFAFSPDLEGLSTSEALLQNEEPLSRSDEGAVQLSHEQLLDEGVPIYHKSTDMATSGGSPFQPGERVRHEKYGLGVVTKVVPMDDSVILNITFESVGKRLLDPSLADLIREPE